MTWRKISQPARNDNTKFILWFYFFWTRLIQRAASERNPPPLTRHPPAGVPAGCWRTTTGRCLRAASRVWSFQTKGQNMAEQDVRYSESIFKCCKSFLLKEAELNTCSILALDGENGWKCEVQSVLLDCGQSGLLWKWDSRAAAAQPALKCRRFLTKCASFAVSLTSFLYAARYKYFKYFLTDVWPTHDQ